MNKACFVKGGAPSGSLGLLAKSAFGPLLFVGLLWIAILPVDRLAHILRRRKRVEIWMLEHDIVALFKPVKECLAGKTLHLLGCQFLLVLHAAKAILEKRHPNWRIWVALHVPLHSCNDARCRLVPDVIVRLLPRPERMKSAIVRAVGIIARRTTGKHGAHGVLRGFCGSKKLGVKALKNSLTRTFHANFILKCEHHLKRVTNWKNGTR